METKQLALGASVIVTAIVAATGCGSEDGAPVAVSDDALRHRCGGAEGGTTPGPDGGSPDDGSAGSDAGGDAIAAGDSSTGADAGTGEDASKDDNPPPGKPIYVAQLGAGAADGASCASAHSVDWFNNAANWGPAAPQVGPGTVVHLCGTFKGQANGTMLFVRGDGTATSPITIYFEPGAVLTAPYWYNNNVPDNSALNIYGRSYVTIHGGASGRIENTANGTVLANQAGTLAINAGNSSHCVIKNLTIANLYVRSGRGCEDDGAIWRAIDLGGSANHVTIAYNTIHDVGWAITNQADVEEIYGNDIYNVDHAIQFGANQGTIGNIAIHDNHIHDFAIWDSDLDCYHHDAIHGFGVPGTVVTDFTAYNNVFDGDTGHNFNEHIFLEAAGAGTPWTSSPNSLVRIFNNVFYASAPSEAMVNTDTGGNSVFVNNTMIGQSLSDGACVFLGDASNLLPGAQVENNAIAGCGALIGGVGPFPVAAFDYNAYGDCSGYNCWFTSLNGVAIDTASFTEWQKASGWDLHSIANTSSKTFFALDATYSPQQGSPLVGAGTNLSSLCTGALAPLCTDRNGKRRPSAGAWDIGAIQH